MSKFLFIALLFYLAGMVIGRVWAVAIVKISPRSGKVWSGIVSGALAFVLGATLLAVGGILVVYPMMGIEEPHTTTELIMVGIILFGFFVGMCVLFGFLLRWRLNVAQRLAERSAKEGPRPT